jgi:hypothetical protein
MYFGALVGVIISEKGLSDSSALLASDTRLSLLEDQTFITK